MLIHRKNSYTPSGERRKETDRMEDLVVDRIWKWILQKLDMGGGGAGFIWLNTASGEV
jgi:hypothetical protein